MINRLLKIIGGKIKFQRLFSFAYFNSLTGMNYGNSGNFEKSGELAAAEYVKAILKNKKERIVIFDVGANLGHYSTAIANIFKENFSIYSFEPSAATYAAMVQNTAATKNVIPCNFGFGLKDERLKLYTNTALSGLASVYKRQLDHFNITMSSHEEISISTIDKFCGEKNIETIDFLKLDIEGNEYNALLGAQKMLKEKKIQFIQFEFGGSNIDSRTYFQDFWYLLHKDYNFYRIVKNGLHPIKEYSEMMEIFVTINFMLQLKS